MTVGRKSLVVLGVSALFLAGALFLCRQRILLWLGDFLVIRSSLRPADIIHVIAGPDHRADYGILLYKQGYGRTLFFTGGWCRIHKLYHGQHGKDRAIAQGVPAEAVSFDDTPVLSTYAEAVRLKEFITHSHEPIRSVIVVSDPHHMRRARWTYRMVFGGDFSLEMAPVPFGMTPYRHDWWSDLRSRRMVGEEYLKIVFYYFRYRLSWGRVRGWLALLDQE